MSKITFNHDDFTPEAVSKQRDRYRESAKHTAPEHMLNNGCPYRWVTTSEPEMGVELILHDDFIDDLLNEPERLKASLMDMAEVEARRTLREFNFDDEDE